MAGAMVDEGLAEAMVAAAMVVGTEAAAGAMATAVGETAVAMEEAVMAVLMVAAQALWTPWWQTSATASTTRSHPCRIACSRCKSAPSTRTGCWE